MPKRAKTIKWRARAKRIGIRSEKESEFEEKKRIGIRRLAKRCASQPARTGLRLELLAQRRDLRIVVLVRSLPPELARRGGRPGHWRGGGGSGKGAQWEEGDGAERTVAEATLGHVLRLNSTLEELEKDVLVALLRRQSRLKEVLGARPHDLVVDLLLGLALPLADGGGLGRELGVGEAVAALAQRAAEAAENALQAARQVREEAGAQVDAGRLVQEDKGAAEAVAPARLALALAQRLFVLRLKVALAVGPGRARHR